ncbi:MAG: ABC transporter permease [Desulfovibrionaceae bacterium]|nr:ABC transporter permease [Desulfovibrionaceae bacterium]
MQGALAVYYREMALMRRRGFRLLAGMAVSPLLYFVTFGQAVGRTAQMDGVSYAAFLLPGLVAMNSMMQAYSMASEINISRFYFRIFDEFMASPIGPAAYVLGEVMAGVTRGLAASAVIVLMGTLFGVDFQAGPLFWLGAMLNAFFFAGLAVAMAMVVRTHQDQATLTNFVITPMAFLGGTFFPVEKLPGLAAAAVWFLPLTHASRAIRLASQGRPVPYVEWALLAGAGLLCLLLAMRLTRRVQD